ncbi:protein TEX261 [Harmonia axyridis]|uniref:protein TEX261 n=1 Tax=Harmonia axyridis TaxID=115357 RepID=UPI001E2768E4|nr:protein TEX261 [Harmonia axyridis]
MLFLTFMTYAAICIQIIYATVAIASGLYYLAELVEEYSSIAKKCITWINIGVTSLFILLWLLEGFPSLMIVCGILAQISHFVILKNFPYVSFLQPSFIVAVLFIVINHLLAFQHFADMYYTFSEVLAYFTLCLWLVPFSLFVSLSANDNVLPMTNDRTDGDVVTNYFSKKGKRYGLLSFFNYAKESLLPMRTKKGF